MAEQGFLKRSADNLRNSVTFKMVVIGILILLLLIPISMVKSLIHERDDRKTEVTKEISSKWGEAQTVTGPVLTIPYRRYYTQKDGTRSFNTRYAHFLPKELAFKGELYPEIRYRGIYEAVLYNAKFSISGEFEHPNFKDLHILEKNVMWDRAVVAVGIADMKGIKDKIEIVLNGKKLSMNPGIKNNDILASGVNARVPTATAKDQIMKFSLQLDLNGSDHIYFTPIGEITRVSLHSKWQTPSFDGAFLPAKREISDEGFNANWKVLHLNRNYPQAWIGKQERLNESSFGVKLFIAADIYQQSTRTAKYAMLFILLTFTTFFFTEIYNRKRLHPIQYLLIGFAVVIFYSLLIAVSEHTSFDMAYILASIAVIGMVTGYANWVLENKTVTLLVGSVLVILYGYLYMILQLEDYALLMGSIGLFVVLSTVMYMTRKIDWYDVNLDRE